MYAFTSVSPVAVNSAVSSSSRSWTSCDARQTVSFSDSKSAGALVGALGGPTTAYIYDWNVLPFGQLLWLKELETFPEGPQGLMRNGVRYVGELMGDGG